MVRINRRDIKLENYQISNNKYNELKFFCLQYEEKRCLADRNPMWRADLELIEQTAVEADTELYPYILKSVTEAIPYEYMDVPCGRRQFYEARRVFYILLAGKR